ncbi:MAG: hypothetical protein ABIG95_02440 [Candidatus Woesearchaeota archaeon]
MKRRKDGTFVPDHEEEELEKQPSKHKNGRQKSDQLLPVKQNFYGYQLDLQTQCIIQELRTGFKIGADFAEEVIEFLRRIGFR